MKKVEMKSIVKIIITGAIVLMGAVNIQAQQVPFYSQYFFNPFVYNPAFTGVRGEIQGFLSHRNQWTGLQGAPITTAVTLEGPIMGDKAGIGANIYSDQTDILRRTGAKFSYSYAVDINSDHRLRFGLALGMLSNNIDYNRASVEDLADPNLFSTSQNKSGLDADFGIGYYWDALEVGIAVPQLFGNNLEYNQVDNDQVVNYGITRHYLLTAKYSYEIDDTWAVYPMFVSRFTPNTPFQFDFSAMGSWNELIWLGGTYKHEYAIGVNAGFKINDKLFVSYSYDIITADIKDFAGSSSEFMVGYTFGTSKKQKEEEARQRQEMKNEIDSLSNKLKETQEQTDKNTEAIDSLGTELEQVKEEVEKAAEQLESGAAGQAPIIAPPTSKENDFSSDFLDNAGNPLTTGFYIVVGSYSEQKLARQSKKKYINAGFPDSDVLYNITNKFYNVYLSFTKDEEEARRNLRNARSEYPDAWLRLIK